MLNRKLSSLEWLLLLLISARVSFVVTRSGHAPTWTAGVPSSRRRSRFADIVVMSIHPRGARCTAVLLPAAYYARARDARHRASDEAVVRALPGLTGVAIAHVVFLLLGFFSLLLFAVSSAAKMFPNYGDALWNLLILLTTSNFPDIMMPAYTLHRSAFFFFFAFLLAGYFFLTNLILAIVCKGHTEQREADLAAEELSQKENLDRAFALLDPAGTGALTRPVMKQLFDELNANRVAVMSEEREELLWSSLDEDMSGTVDEAEFSTMCLLLRVRLSRVTTSTLLLRNFPSLGRAAATAASRPSSRSASSMCFSTSCSSPMPSSSPLRSQWAKPASGRTAGTRATPRPAGSTPSTSASRAFSSSSWRSR